MISKMSVSLWDNSFPTWPCACLLMWQKYDKCNLDRRGSSRPSASYVLNSIAKSVAYHNNMTLTGTVIKLQHWYFDTKKIVRPPCFYKWISVLCHSVMTLQQLHSDTEKNVLMELNWIFVSVISSVVVSQYHDIGKSTYQ